MAHNDNDQLISNFVVMWRIRGLKFDNASVNVCPIEGIARKRLMTLFLFR